MAKQVKAEPKIQDYTADKIAEPEKLVINKACRVKEHGAKFAKKVKAGDVVLVSGMAKLELLFRPIDDTKKLAEYAETKELNK